MRDVVGDILGLGEEQQLEDARTHAPLVEVGGERYCRVEQERDPETIYHGLWGSHRIEAPLYRLAGMRKMGRPSSRWRADLASWKGRCCPTLRMRRVT